MLTSSDGNSSTVNVNSSDTKLISPTPSSNHSISNPADYNAHHSEEK